VSGNEGEKGRGWWVRRERLSLFSLVSPPVPLSLLSPLQKKYSHLGELVRRAARHLGHPQGAELLLELAELREMWAWRGRA